MAVPIQSQISNPITGVFGIGQMQIFSASGTWIVPPGVAKVRVRMWGAGANYCAQSSYFGAGGGGGFALKAIYDLTGVTSVAVTVGSGNSYISSGATAAGFQAGTSSFGSYCSATGGICGATSSVNNGGTGVGGDINNSGGRGGFGGGATTGGGGGSASLIGGGANATVAVPGPSFGGAGAGFGSANSNLPGSGGFMTTAGVASTTTSFYSTMPTASIQPFSIDFVGTGGGGGLNQGGVNGGGGGYNASGGFPGGGTAYGAPTDALSAGGLVIVEW
jgi:hypothetical protein